MVIYSSAPRASIDGAWESRFDTVRSYSLSESGVRDPSGIFTCRSFRSSNGQAYRWSIIPFSISPTGRHQVFGCRMSTFMVSLKLTSFIFQDRKNVSLRVGTKFENNLSKERKRANPTVNIILEKKFRISLFIIGRWLDRDREIFRLSMYVRGIGILGEKCSDTIRSRQLGSPLVGSREAATCCISWKAQPDSVSLGTLGHRFTWMYWFLHWFNSLLLFIARIITCFFFFLLLIDCVHRRNSINSRRQSFFARNSSLKIDDRTSFTGVNFSNYKFGI